MTIDDRNSKDFVSSYVNPIHLEDSCSDSDPVGGATVDIKHGDFHVNKSEITSGGNELLFTSPASKKGVSINVYKQCVNGNCSCVHFLGNEKSQLRPCRFAALLFGSGRVPSEDEMLMYNGVVDGFSLVSSDVEGYDNRNYLSILTDGNKPKMDAIVYNEIANGMLKIVDQKPKCVHSLGAVSKPDGGIRPITDCSLPEGKCINEKMDGLVKSFKFKNVDDVVNMTEEGDYISVVDIKSAYRAVSVNPDHTDLQGIRWQIDGEEKFLEDKRLCCAPFYFYLISEFIYNVLSDRYGLLIVNYLDDFAAVSRSYDEGLFAQNCMIQLIRYLGFWVSWSKVSSPSQCATFLGIIIDTVKLELRLPEVKIAKALALLKKVNGCKSISRKNLEKLTGLLAHCAVIVKGGRTFCRRLYDLHKVALKKHLKVIRLSSEAQADISWWLKFIRVFNGRSTIKKELYGQKMVSDSSLLGYGAHLGKDWLYGAWGKKDLYDSECSHLCNVEPNLSDTDRANINVLELWPVVMGIQRWGHDMSGKVLEVVVDNLQVMYMLKTGHSVNCKCMEWLREIFWMCVNLDLELKPVYIKSEENVLADTLSRILYNSTFMKLPELLSNFDICCKDGVLLYSSNDVGATRRVQDSTDEEIGSPVYYEEQARPMEMLPEILY